ncbi:MAG: RNA chaperone Hfq [Terriglobales bacterium]
MPFRVPGLTQPFKKAGKLPPPEDTFEEAAYLKLLGEKQRPVAVKLMDGEVVRGWIEYYDRNMVRLTRDNAPNLFIFKHEIMYIAEEGQRRPARPQGQPQNGDPGR